MRSGHPATLACVPAPYPESQSYQRYPGPEREDADEPRQGEQSRPRQGEQDYAQKHPQDAAQSHGPLVVDLPPQQYGADYPQEPAQDGPESDDVEQNDRANAGPEDGDKTGQDAQCSLGQQQPPACSAARPEPRDDGENPVDQGVGTVEYDQNREGKAWPDQRRQTEEDGGDPSHGQRPPATGYRRKHGWSLHMAHLFLLVLTPHLALRLAYPY